MKLCIAQKIVYNGKRFFIMNLCSFKNIIAEKFFEKTFPVRINVVMS